MKSGKHPGRRRKISFASSAEVLEFLTGIMLGSGEDGDESEQRKCKGASAKDRMRAAELLGKYHKLFATRYDAEPAEESTVVDDI